MKKIFISLLISLLISALFSCGRYRQNIMFQVDEDSNYDTLKTLVDDLNANYLIEPNDYLTIKVYTSDGEMLIDPENLYNAQGSSGTKNSGSLIPRYLVDFAGFVNLPMVGKLKIDSLSIPQADSVLALKYNEYYANSFVKTTCDNRRVTVLGAMGGLVISLENENTSLIEVLALAGGLDNTAKAQNIRLIRGDLSHPEVQIIDLSTIEGMKTASLKVQNHDIVYVEPVRKVVNEAFRDISPIVSLTTSLITLIFVFSSRSR